MQSRSASVPILATKLFLPPARPGLVERPRLFAHLGESLNHPLTLISAPAGSGKTTLLGTWQAHTPHPLAWFSIDQEDNDPIRFWLYFIAAIQQVKPELGENVLSFLTAHFLQPVSNNFFLIILLNELAASQDRLILILDDYHLIETPAIHDGLLFLLDHSPPNLHLVILTRTDPPWSLGRLRARNQLTEIRAGELSFTSTEAAQFFKQCMGLSLSEPEILALKERTEGWVTGLQLAGLSLKESLSFSKFIDAFTGSHRYVLDYLIEEVFQRQTERIQSFLLKTCILERLTGPLCDHVTEEDGSETLLQLEQANLFIIPLDNERKWYRYHQLFVEFLQNRLRLMHPDIQPDLYRRASNWYEGHGLITEAVRHARAAGDFGGMANMLERCSQAMLMRGEVMLLKEWIEDIPNTLVSSRPRLSLTLAWVKVIQGQIEEADHWLSDVENRWRSSAQTEPDLWVEARVVRAIAATTQMKDAASLELARRTLTLVPIENSYLRNAALMNLGGALIYAGEANEANQVLEQEAIRLSYAAGDRFMTLVITMYLVSLRILQGQLHEAERVAQQALELASAPNGQPMPFACMPLAVSGELFYQWNDLAAAKLKQKQSLELAEQWGNPEALSACYLLQARLSLASDRWVEALDALDQASKFASGRSVHCALAAVAGLRLRCWMKQGNFERAKLYATQRGLNLADEPNYSRETEYLAFALLVIENYGISAEVELLQGAIGLLERLFRSASGSGRVERMIEILAIQALAFKVAGQPKEALKLLRKALSMAEPEGYVRIFLDLGSGIAALLQQLKSNSGELKRYVTMLLDAFASSSSKLDETDLSGNEFLSLSESFLLVERLSERELEVMRLVSRGFSNREIAKELIITLGTVKRHLNNIFVKVGVNRRTQAVALLRELNLL